MAPYAAQSRAAPPLSTCDPKMQSKLFFNLRKAKSRISALEEGDLRPDQVKVIAKRLGVTEQDVVDVNRGHDQPPRLTDLPRHQGRNPPS
jgi:DNA-directed RNA polymerase sigma subunit (sigma70/sigma32)